MYKTVRHGENSLQYKILAQQEEGLTNVKCRKPSRAVTLKLLTVVILFIVGIIVSAVLVPLVLTNDFFTLTGTFQKFSVSTLRRTHSGNHVVVIAKKPFGWNGPHASSPPKLTNASQNHTSNAKVGIPATSSTSTSKTTSTVVPTLKTTTEETTARRTTPKIQQETTQTSFIKEQTVPHSSTPTTTTEQHKSFQTETNWGFVQPKINSWVTERPPSTTEGQKSFHSDVGSSSSNSMWFRPDHKWEFRPPQINTWTGSGITSNPDFTFVAGCVLFLVVIILIFVGLRKTLSGRRTVTEKETAESKEDKARLLKPSARGSDEE